MAMVLTLADSVAREHIDGPSILSRARPTYIITATIITQLFIEILRYL